MDIHIGRGGCLWRKHYNNQCNVDLLGTGKVAGRGIIKLYQKGNFHVFVICSRLSLLLVHGAPNGSQA